MTGGPDAPASRVKIFLIAGEPSGDVLGAKLMAALKRTADGLVCVGVGGERMAAEGLESLYPLDDIAIMGLTEVVRRLARLRRRLDDTVQAIRRERPAAVVTIDSPSFSLRVSSRVRGTGVKRIHYVAPQLWAWRPGRARRLARQTDHLMALLPFEPEFFARLGVPCTYVGHPVIEDAVAPADRPAHARAFRARYGIDPEAKLVAVLPGSRADLVRRMLPVFAAAVGLLSARIKRLHVVLPTVALSADLVAAAGWPVSRTIVEEPADKRDALLAADAGLTVSGTATLELAVAGLPMVVAYKVSRLSGFLVRRLIRVPHVAMPNLVIGRQLVPELLQEDCRPARIAAELGRLIDDPAAAAGQRQGLAEIRARLGRDGPTPSERAARVVLAAIGARPADASGA
ncbi:MAG: lipid-A-disaccharide synthase [Pseudomonadota bacterium]